MFSNLRTNSQLYILHKESTPYIEVGQVLSVSQPQPRFPVANFMNPQELVVDVVVRINGNDITLQKLPANLDVADQGTANGCFGHNYIKRSYELRGGFPQTEESWHS